MEKGIRKETEGGGQRTEDRGLMTGDGGRMTENRVEKREKKK